MSTRGRGVVRGPVPATVRERLAVWQRLALLGPVRLLDWVDQAACATEPGNWFAEPEDTGHELQVCRGCSVQQQCLAYALNTGEEHGIWGGYTPAERDELRLLRRRVRAAA